MPPTNLDRMQMGRIHGGLWSESSEVFAVLTLSANVCTSLICHFKILACGWKINMQALLNHQGYICFSILKVLPELE